MLDWFLMEWLRTLQVSQADLVRRTDYPKAKISDLATGKQRYNRDILNDVASALNLRPHELLMHPSDAMSQRRIKMLAEEMVRVPFAGTAGEPSEDSTEGRKAS